jgi:hypothetical protein
MVAESLWISRSSWSANNFAFTAAADRPQLAAYFTPSGERGEGESSVLLSEIHKS